jgi:hypothetical protein
MVPSESANSDWLQAPAVYRGSFGKGQSNRSVKLSLPSIKCQSFIPGAELRHRAKRIFLKKSRHCLAQEDRPTAHSGGRPKCWYKMLQSSPLLSLCVNTQTAGKKPFITET